MLNYYRYYINYRAAHLKQGFNFLKPQVEPPSAWSYVYDWIVGTARAILIVFEIAVVVALALRIMVDVQSKILDTKIDTLENIMAPRESEEQKYRKLQTKTKSYATIWTNGQVYSEIFKVINDFIPISAVKFDVNIEGKTITISGKALKNDVMLVENGLKASHLFSNVRLTGIDMTNEENEDDDSYTGDNYSFNCTLQEQSFRSLYDGGQEPVDGEVTE